MPKNIEGKLTAQGLRFAIVASRFNSFIGEKLVAGAQDALLKLGADESNITTVWVPGAFELPAVARRLAEGPYDGIICVGVVIRGSTPHFDYVAGEAAKGIGQVAFTARHAAVGFGVLTCDTIEQAIERAGTKAGNKGFDAAMTVVEMANLYRELEKL